MGRDAPDPWQPRMVGRTRDLEGLRERFAAASEQPQAVLIGGDAGIGKSRLVAELSGSVAGTARTVVGHCLELGPDAPPLSPFAMIIHGLIAELGVREVARLAGAGAADLAVLAAELGAGDADEALGRGLLFDAMATLIERVADERPLIMVVEDLHWSDASTRDLLRFLIRSVRDVHLLILLTYRRDELHRGHPVLAWLAEIDRIPRTSRLLLGPLPDDAVNALVAQLAGEVPPAVRDRIRERSQGIPFFVEELAGCVGGSEELPESLRDLMLVRLDRLSPAAREVVRSASAGGFVAHALLREVVGMPQETFERALREAVESLVLVVDRDLEAYGFRHELMREAVHADLLPGEHARLHGRLAAAMEPAARPSQAGEIAHHWDSAHDPARTFPWLVRAAAYSQSIYAWSEERAHLERALELWDQVGDPARSSDPSRGSDPARASDPPRGSDPARAAMLARASRAAFLQGEAHRSLTLLDAALREVDAARWPQEAARLRLQRAQQRQAGSAGDALADVDLALQLAAPASLERSEALVLRAGLLMVEGDATAAVACAREALACAQIRADAPTTADAHNTLGCALLETGDARGLEHLEQARLIASEAGAWSATMRYYSNYTDVLIGAGRFAQAVALARRGRSEAASRGRLRTYGVFLAANEAEAQVRAGDWDDALATISEGLRLGPMSATGAHLLTLRAEILALRGEVEAAEVAADRAAERLGGATRQPQHALPLASVRAEIAALRGDLAGSLAGVRRALGSVGALVPPPSGWPFAWTWARILLDWVEVDAGSRNEQVASQAELAGVVKHLFGVSDHPGWRAMLAALSAEIEGILEAEAPRVGRVDGDELTAGPVSAVDGLAGPVSAEGRMAGPVRAADALSAGRIPDWAAAVAAVAAGEGLRYELAHARIRWAGQLIALGDRDEARRQLLAAVSQIDRMRAESLRPAAAKIAAMGRISLARRRRRRSLLTAREREVLELVAQGKSNRAIADALFISTKTASVHVSNIMAKIGASSRTEAAAWAHAHAQTASAGQR